ncbi:MAG TPA: hypothetical protein VGP68_01735, partial [Gemmataceae bacterium]|nr:hypothetical protein [Gemmataceae bacterium]
MFPSFLLMAWALVPFAAKSLDAAPPVRATNSTELIGKLGSRDYREREAAMNALDVLGGTALEGLRKAVHDKDPEVRRRAETLVEVIERREETAKLLAPRSVHLKLKNVPLRKAVADLAQESGFSVIIDSSALDRARNQRITLDTGETTFWKALDALTRQAALVDSTAPTLEPRPVARNSPDAGLQILRGGQRLAMYPVAAHEGPTQYYLHPFDKGRDQESVRSPVCYAGALRFRIGHPIKVQRGEMFLPIEVSPQPNVIWEQLTDLRVEKAIDDRGQELTQALAAADSGSIQINQLVMGLGNGMVLNATTGLLEPIAEPGGAIRLKCGDLRSRKLASLSGTIIGQMRTPVQTLVSVEKVRQQGGKTFRTRYGEKLEVTEVKDLADGSVRLQVRLMEPPTTVVMPGNGRIAARANLVLRGRQVFFNRMGARTEGDLHADLLIKDEEGRPVPLDTNFQTSISFVNN